MAPDSNKSGKAPWKPCEEKIRVMKMGKRMGKKKSNYIHLQEEVKMLKKENQM